MSEQSGEVGRPWTRIRWRHLAPAGAVVLATASLTLAATRSSPSGAAGAPTCGSATPRLIVQGVGQASGNPDALEFNAQVSVTAGSAKGALAADDSTSTAVVQAIEAAGVKPKDIQTTDLTINPTYNPSSNGRTVISGYQVSNSVAVRVRPVAGAGAVIDAATTAGGDALSVDSLSFTRVDPRTLEDHARRDAVRQAVAHAAAMARASGERLGAVCSLTDQSNLDQSIGEPASTAAAPFAPLAGPPLEGGTQQASAQVRLVYELTPLGG